VTNLKNADGSSFFDPNDSIAAGTSPGPSAAISAVMSILTFLNTQSVQYAIQSAFIALKPTLDSSISAWAADNETGMCYEDALVGCVVQSVLYQLSGPIGSDATYSFVGVYACNCGLDYQTALTATLRQGSILPAGPDGSTLVCNYFWYKQE
jgi:ABC-type glucose/galactose transport system permease subunit